MIHLIDTILSLARAEVELGQQKHWFDLQRAVSIISADCLDDLQHLAGQQVKLLS
jgi:hypothetical protein